MSSDYENELTKLRAVFENYQRVKPIYEREMAEKKKKCLRNFIIVAFTCVLCIYGVYAYFTRDGIFIELCRTGTPEELKAAIEKNIWDVNMYIHDGIGRPMITPYMLALRENRNPEVLRVLEQAGAKPDKNKTLEWAANIGNIEMVKFLVQNGATNVDYALKSFVDRGDVKTVKFLVQNGATNVDYALERFVNREDVGTVKFLVQNGATNVDYALKRFADRGDVETVKFLVQNGATNMDYALRQFADRGNIKMVKFLLQNGATDKNNALESAAYYGKIEMVKFLLQNGATNKNAALESAVRGGQLEMAKFLIQSGAKVDDWYTLWRKSGSNSKKIITDLEPNCLEQAIIRVAKKYDFEIVAHKNEYMNGFKIIAQEKSLSGCVYFCTDRILMTEGYLIFSPDAIYGAKYYQYDPLFSSIREGILTGNLLNRTESALKELCE